MLIKADFNAKKAISPRFYGIFFEDINFSIDGGMNNNQIINKSLAATRTDFKKNFAYLYTEIFHARRRYRTRVERAEPLKYWEMTGAGELDCASDAPIAPENPLYMEISVEGKAFLRNKGYNGGDSTEKKGRYLRRNSGKPAVGVAEGAGYDVSVFIRNANFTGTLSCYVEGASGEALTTEAEVRITSSGSEWTKVTASCRALKTGIGTFVARFEGNGTLNLTEWYFGASEYWGKGDTKWTGGRLRKDLVEALRELKPKFMRFPGGCLVEGCSLDNSYDWKLTVGPVERRKAKFNLWGEAQRDRTYIQSNEIGFYEYFLLSEDLGAEPLPILNAGLACQGRCFETVTEGDAEFERRKQNVLDLIEYANGDPATSKWAKLRADSGHPAPFNLKMIGIGNENFGELYNKNFDIMAKAVKDKYPEIEIVWSAGFDCYKHKNYESTRSYFDGKHPDAIVDDHFYRTPQWTIENAGLYDDYPRSRNRIFLGEYAANEPWNSEVLWNNYYSALAEAAFLTGLERNADIVVMSSYAPLFSRVGGEQWKHNLINYNSLYLMKTANYFVQQCFSANYGAEYVPVDAAVKDGVYTSVTTDGKYAYVKAVNVNRAEMNYALEPAGAAFGEKAKYTILQCDDDEARNELGYAGEPVYKIAPITAQAEISGALETTLPARSVCVFRVPLG